MALALQHPATALTLLCIVLAPASGTAPAPAAVAPPPAGTAPAPAGIAPPPAGIAPPPAAATPWASPPRPYPETPRIAVTDTLHGVALVDPYRWLEDSADPRVQAWVVAQSALTRALLDSLPQRPRLIARLTELMRCDHERVPERALAGERLFYSRRAAGDEKWTYWMRRTDDASSAELIDPNQWPREATLAGTAPSRDGRLVAFGTAHAGDENPIVRVLETDTGRLLPDTLQGWKHYVNAWLPDASGFYYSAKPRRGTVPEGDEHYWPSLYFHRLGTPAADDVKIFSHPTVREYWHDGSISEDGRYLILSRSLFNTNEVYYQELGKDDDPIPLAIGFDASYTAHFIEDKILILTDSGAPQYMVYVTDNAHPGRQHWRMMIPERTDERLSYIKPVAGHIYAVYVRNAYDVIRIYDLEGRHLRDLPLPALGSASVSGHWSRDDVWVEFESYTYPPSTYKYNFASNTLELYRAHPLEVDLERFVVEQVWYPSKDGTRVSMFLVHDRSLVRDGGSAVCLTGYGGFDVAVQPRFSPEKIPWLEAGGVLAVPNLRGGGEYGRAWHEAGMREKKQNVFDDFLAAAEWLIAQGYTSPAKLVISGGSNGGLLVGAACVQRPELFRAVDCAVPLLDMVRYHLFRLANIWAEEYGSAADPQQFAYLRRYSPYHNVVAGTAYPASLVSSGENDARVDPLHARKMVAALQHANPGGEPALLLEYRASGHGGGTTLSDRIADTADRWSFLMHAAGMP